MSDASRRAAAFVAARLPEARRLGTELAAEVDDPEAFARRLADGLARLADARYAAAQLVVAPGIRGAIGVRTPLLRAVESPVRRALATSSPATALYLADHLSRSRSHEARVLAMAVLRRSLGPDPERSWQVIRRLARDAGDWVTVDDLAALIATGVLGEPYRWAELEQLVYSPHRWERRLVASTIARLPFSVPAPERPALRGFSALGAIESLLGDREPDVQKALAWALRSWALVDPSAVERLIEDETRAAVDGDDGHRAWVVRDALPAVSPGLAARLRERLRGIRRRPSAPSTSRAARLAGPFLAAMPEARTLAEAPLR